MSNPSRYRDIINRYLDLCDQDDPRDLADSLRSLSELMTRAHEQRTSEAAVKRFLKECEPWWDISQLAGKP